MDEHPSNVSGKREDTQTEGTRGSLRGKESRTSGQESEEDRRGEREERRSPEMWKAYHGPWPFPKTSDLSQIVPNLLFLSTWVVPGKLRQTADAIF
jgi:hypothetical protein